MHDVDRNSILYKNWEKKKHAGHAHGDDHTHHDAPHPGDHETHLPHEHDHPHPKAADHGHAHDEVAYANHDHDGHAHDHPPGSRFSRDRVFSHLHEHKHLFYHSHHHRHDPAHRTLIHKVFKDPVRDWFGLGLMILMIIAGYYRWLPGTLSDGILVCAALIGIFPAFKNALFSSLARRWFTLELFICTLMIAGLLTGRFLEISLFSLFMLIGSFMRLDFSWRTH